MKFVCLLLLGLCASLSAVEDSFVLANQLYFEGSYEAALTAYESIESKNSSIWYNMGNCAYHLNNYHDALVYWRRAQRNAPSLEQEHIVDNIRAIYEKLGRPYQMSWLQRLTNQVHKQSCAIPLLVLQLLTVLMWWLLMALLILMRAGALRILSIVLLSSCVIMGSSALAFTYKVRSRPVAVAQQSGTTFVGPNARYHVCGTLERADEVMIVQQLDDWCKIKHNGQVVWTQASNLLVV